MAITDIRKLLVTHRTDDRDLFPLSSPTTDLGANSTSIATAIAIGFTFTLDGVGYTTCALSSKGFLRLAGTVTSATNSNLFAAIADVVLAPWWDDMETVTTGGYVKHETQGTAPWRRFVAEWYCNFNTASGDTNYIRAKFQAVLYESTNRIDFRYGTFESGGSGVNTSSASIGLKGDTTGSADNYIDLAVDDRDLGGSQTTSTTSLRAYVPGEWPGYTIVVEPNWPMPGFYVDTPLDTLTGMQDPYCDPLWAFCAAVNWLYCRHTPTLVNFEPYNKPSTTFNNPIHVVPIIPSADTLTYRVWIEIYNGASGSASVTVDVDRDAAADPQPATGADWTNIDSATRGSLSTATHYSIDPFDVQIVDSALFLRFKFTGNDLLILSINVAPVPLDEVDPSFTYPSGFVPMAIGQFRQQGSGVHPETYNRAYRNVARILADRQQILWSFGNNADASEYGYTGDPVVRVLGVATASLRGWNGQDCTTVVYAYDSSNNGALQFTERGGFSGDAFDIDTNGSEYRRQDGTLSLLSDQPTVALTADPMGTMRVMFAGVFWAPNVTDQDLIAGLTPPPKLVYLLTLAQTIRRACLYAYSMTGLASLLRIGSATHTYCAWLVPPATKALRAKLIRSNQSGKTSTTAVQPTSIFATSSGATGDDEILIDSPYSNGRDQYPPDHDTAPASTSNLYDVAPAQPENRLLESPTIGWYTGPIRELVRVRYGVGICLVPVPDDPTA